MSGRLIFLEFLNVFRKWYDAGTTGHERGGASVPESSGLRVHREFRELWEFSNERMFEGLESWTMFVMLSFLEFLNVVWKWYDAGTAGNTADLADDQDLDWRYSSS